MRLKDKVAIVTGSGAGLGRAIALAMAREGAKVVLNDVSTTGLEEATAEVRALGSAALAVISDISNRQQVEEMVSKAVETFGRIDILVNNAGGGLHTARSLDEISEEDWDKVLNVNLKGAFFCSQAVIRQMRKQANGGKIVNMSALAAKTYGTLAGVQYTSAKAGIGGLTRHLAHEVGPDGINVNAVAPTVILSGERMKALWETKTEAEKQKVLESIPLRRLATPEEIAKAVVFLASEDASYITGVTLDVNGGRYMS